MQVETLMTPDPVSIGPGSSLDHAMELMDEHAVRHLPVVDDGDLVGVISDRDLLDATGWLHPRQLEALEAPLETVGQLVSDVLDTVTPDDDMDVALERFVSHRVGCLPVLSAGHLVGIVTEMDVLRAYADSARRGQLPRTADRLVRDCMTPDPVSAAPTASGDELASQLAELKVHHLPIVQGTELVGIVSDRDLRRAHGRGQLEVLLAHELMAPAPQTIRADAALSSAALLMNAERISALPVMEGNELVGLLTTLDALVPCARALQDVSDSPTAD